MIDPELKRYLISIEQELNSLNKKNHYYSYFLAGLVSGIGYITGAALVLVIVGWILNVVGIIPALGSVVTSFKHALDVISKASLH